MISKLAYEVSYTTEHANGEIDTHDMHTRYFATREQAVAHARHITNSETDNNGVFSSGWITPYASFFGGDDIDKILVTATVATVTISEIEESL